jgi:hypothetical protein
MLNTRNILSALFFLVFIGLQNQAFAQSENETKTLFGDGPKLDVSNLGVFLAPSIVTSKMDGSNAALFNIRGGLSWKDRISFGGFFNTSLNQINPKSETIANIYMDYWSAGGFLEYTLFPDKLIHMIFPLQIGYGEVQMDNESGETGLGEANFFQLEPSALLEINLHKYIRFNVGAGYRILGDMNYRNFNQSDLSGLTGHAGLRIGLFR